MSLGMPEILIIFFIVLLLFGAKKLPELAKGLGKGLKEFKQATKDPEIEEKPQVESGEKKRIEIRIRKRLWRSLDCALVI